MSFKVQIHYSDSDVTIRPVFHCRELGKLTREINFKTRMWEYELSDLEKISKILKDSGLGDDQIELIETSANSFQDTEAYKHKRKHVGWEFFENRILLSYTYNLGLNELVKTFSSKKFDMKTKRWSVDTIDWLTLSQQLEDSGYLLQSLLIHPQLGITTFDCEPKPKKQTKNANCFAWMPKTSKQEYDDTPMSTKEWKEHVLKD